MSKEIMFLDGFLREYILESELKDYFVLKGGNCFRKAYFENTRFSNDLDFSLKSDLTEDYIKKELNNVCDFVHGNAGIVFDKGRNRVEPKKRVDPYRKAYDARIYSNIENHVLRAWSEFNGFAI